MKDRAVMRDERTVAVENASYRWGYLVLSFGLLLLVAYRSFTLGEANWDLLGLVILGGLVSTLYQGLHRVLAPRWAVVAGVTMLAAAVVALLLVYLR